MINKLTARAEVLTWHKVCARVVALTTCMALGPCLWAAGEGNADGVSVDHVSFRKLSSFDNGTVHMFVKNEGSEPVTVRRVVLNGTALPPYAILGLGTSEIGMTALTPLPSGGEEIDQDERVIWYQVLPNPIPPGKVGDVRVKWSFAPYKLINIAVETVPGGSLERVIQPVNNRLRLTCVGFSKGLDRVYIYFENSGKRELKPKRIFFNTRDVTSFALKWCNSILPGEKRCFVVSLDRPFSEGEYVAVKLLTEQDLVAESLVTASSFFPITAYEGYRPGFNFDPIEYLLRYPGDALVTGDTLVFGSRMLHLLDCPMHAHGTHRAAAEKAVLRGKEALNRFLSLPTSMYICKVVQEQGSFLFGEIADAVISNVAQPSVFREPERTEHPTQRTARIMKQGCSPQPWHALINAGFDKRFPEFKERLPVPEEERLIVYHSLSRGAKGLFYYFPGWDGASEKPRERLRNGICRINEEVRSVRELLALGEWVPLAKTTTARVLVDTILVGHEAILLFVINDDYNSVPEEGPAAFTYRAKENLVVNLVLPEGMNIKEVSDVATVSRPVEWSVKGREIKVKIEQLDLTRLFVLTAADGDIVSVQQGTVLGDKTESVKDNDVSASSGPRSLTAEQAKTTHERSLVRRNVAAVAGFHDSEGSDYVEALYKCGEELLHEIDQLKWRYENLPRYDEVIDIATQVVEGAGEADVALRAQLLIVECYGKKAEYPAKEAAFSKYVKMVQVRKGIDQAVEAIIKSADTDFNRGTYYDAKRRYTKVIRGYAQHPRVSYALSRRADCWNRLERPSRAIEDYRRALSGDLVSSDFAGRIYLKFAGLLGKERRFSEAVDTLHELLGRFSESSFTPDAQFYAAYFRYKAGDYQAAEKEWSKLLARYPESALASIARKFLGQMKGARASANDGSQ